MKNEIDKGMIHEIAFNTNYATVGYITFVLALIFALISGNDNINHKALIVCLLICSLPSLVAYLLINYLVAVEQVRKDSGTRGLAALLGQLPSFIGIFLLIGNYSWIASIIFTLLIVFWGIMYFIVVKRGNDPTSQI